MKKSKVFLKKMYVNMISIFQPQAIHSKDADSFNASLLHIACENSDLKMIKMLIESYSMDVNIEDKEQATPIFYACRQGNLEVIKYLHQKGAKLEHKEFQDRTPLYVAASNGEVIILRYLLQNGCEVDVPTKLGRSALSKACWNGRIDVVEILVNSPGINLNRQDVGGRSALHNACWGSNGGRLGKKTALNP